MELVTEIEKLILLLWHQTLDLPKLTLLHKTLKAARLAMVDRVVLNCTNTELLAANRQKKRWLQWTGFAYNDQGAPFLNPEVVEKRRQLVGNRAKDKEAK